MSKACIDTLLYCHCRKPHIDGQTMIQCESCNEWYHLECIGFTEKEAMRTKHYTCSKCPKLSNYSQRRITIENDAQDIEEMTKIELEEEATRISKVISDIEFQLLGYSDEKESSSVLYVDNIKIPTDSIPIRADIREFDFGKLAREQKKLTSRLFDAIVLDPPWQLASANPTRGVAIAYDTLSDYQIENLPIGKLQRDGLIFIWVINAKYRFTLYLMEKWGYAYCDEIVWIKHTINRRLAKGHGFYLQHAKETCLIGKKGNDPPGLKRNVLSDVIYSERQGQSQKPQELYELIENLIPQGFFLEIFGRRNNIRNKWITIGNEL